MPRKKNTSPKKTAGTKPAAKKKPVARVPATRKKAAPVKKKPGRPKAVTPEIEEQILALICDGKSLVRIAKLEIMPARSTINKHLLDDEGFSDRYARACALRGETLVDEMLEIADETAGDFYEDADGNKKVDHENIHRSKLRVDTRKWMAAKLAPKKYGTKVESVVPGEGEGNQTHIHIHEQ